MNTGDEAYAPRMSHSVQITFACEDPASLATFWAGALGYIRQPPPDGFDSWDEFAVQMEIPQDKWNDIDAVIDPEGVGPRLLFERWDVGGPSKQVHLDINSVHGEGKSPEEVAETLAAERERLEALGATFHRIGTGLAGETWMEMFDPEGNWLCVQ
jgi:hypothetical protein